MDEFPDTIIYSKTYNDWVTRAGPLYELDAETGVAVHCGSRIVGQMTYHLSNLEPATPKCCTPDIDCSQCRMYSGGWSSKFQPREADVASDRAFSDWIDVILVLGRIFLFENPPAAFERRDELQVIAAE